MKSVVSWRRNLWVLLPGTFITSVAFSEFFPFMSLYVNQLGNFTSGQVSILSGIVYSITSLIVMFTSPIWGHFADQHGRKWMILQTALGSAISIALMGLASNVWEFISLRALQGFFGGVIPNSIALIGTETPKRHSQYILSIFSIGYTSGGLIGPLIGGILDHYFSIRNTFFITGALLFIFFLISLFLVKEHFRPQKKVKSKFHWNFMRSFANRQFIGWILITTVIVQIGINTVYPIITLFVKQLMNNHGPIAVVSGIITALPGIFDVMASPLCGKLGDRHGTGMVLLLGMILLIFCYLPQGAAVGLWTLGIFRALNGVGDAAIFPSVQTLLAKGTSANNTGMAFSLNQGAQAMGSCIGALLGGVLANSFGYRVTFYFAGVLILVNLMLLKWRVPQLKKI